MLVVSLIDSTYGRGFLTVRDDEVAAEAMGINTTQRKVVAFVSGAFLAGLAGGLFAHETTYINPNGFDFPAVHRNRGHGHPRRHGQHGGRGVRGRAPDGA